MLCHCCPSICTASTLQVHTFEISGVASLCYTYPILWYIHKLVPSPFLPLCPFLHVVSRSSDKMHYKQMFRYMLTKSTWWSFYQLISKNSSHPSAEILYEILVPSYYSFSISLFGSYQSIYLFTCRSEIQPTPSGPMLKKINQYSILLKSN